jgi:hypothetical protein
VLQDLKNNYLEIESRMENQGRNVDVVSPGDRTEWGDSLGEIVANVHTKHRT